MEIIGRRGWSKQITCRKCRTRLRISKEDLKHLVICDDHGEDDVLGVECPVCHEREDFTNKVPSFIYDELVYGK